MKAKRPFFFQPVGLVDLEVVQKGDSGDMSLLEYTYLPIMQAVHQMVDKIVTVIHGEADHGQNPVGTHASVR